MNPGQKQHARGARFHAAILCIGSLMALAQPDAHAQQMCMEYKVDGRMLGYTGSVSGWHRSAGAACSEAVTRGTWGCESPKFSPGATTESNCTGILDCTKPDEQYEPYEFSLPMEARACAAAPAWTPAPGCAAGAGGFGTCAPATGQAPPPPDPDTDPDTDDPGQNNGPPVADVPDDPESCPAPSVNAIGNPIHAASGNKYQREVDLSGPSRLSLVRHYNSTLRGWQHNYAMRLVPQGSAMVALRPDGRVLVYRQASDGAWRSNATVQATLQALPETTPDGTRWKLIDEQDRAEWYDASGKPTRIVERAGRTLSLAYAGGQLAAVTDAFGRGLTFGYDAQGRVARVDATGGGFVQYGYDALGRLASAAYADGTSRGYLYEDGRHPHALTGLIDEGGRRAASWTYDSKGRAISSEHAGGTSLHTLLFDDANGSVLVTDPLGTLRQLRHQTVAGRTIFAGSDQPCANCSGDASNRQIDDAGHVLARTDFTGARTEYSFDDRGLPVQRTEAAGRPEERATQTQWHPQWRLPVQVNEPGRSTAYSYDERGNLTERRVTDTQRNQTRVWRHTYDANNLLTSSTDPRGAVTTYGHDTQGNLNRITNALGQATNLEHDAAGRLSRITEPNGLISTYAYDARGRLTRQDVGGEVTTYAWSASGQLAQVQHPNGQRVDYSHDAADRLIQIADNRGNRITYTLDAMGNRVQEDTRDAQGTLALSLRRGIDALNRVSALAGAQGQNTQIGHDANGQPISQTDPLGHTTRQTLDALGRPVATTYPDNAQTTQAWNERDDLSAVTDPKGVSTSYERNAFGEVLRETSPDSGTTVYERDAAGDISARTDAKGQRSTYERDALGRITRVTHADGKTERWIWDEQQTGSLSRIEDASGAVDYVRDPQGRITRKTQSVKDNPSSPTTLTTDYAWAQGELASITYPSGFKVFYRRDETGQITGIDTQAPGGTVKKPKPIEPFVTHLTHTALGQPRAWNWSNGDSATRVFDADGRMTSNEFASYGFDAAGRITSITQSLWATSTATGTVTRYQTPLVWTVQYDNRNRLTSFARPGSSVIYSYDANSNRLASQVSTTSDTDLDGAYEDETDLLITTSQAQQIEAASNRLLGYSQTVVRTRLGKTRSVIVTPVAYSLDANGSLESDGLRSFEHDASARLAAVRIVKDGEAVRATYLTNALGQRVFASEPQPESTQPSQTELSEGFIAWLKKSFSWLFTRSQTNASIGTAYSYADGQLPEWALLGEYDNGSATGAGRTEFIWLPTPGGAIPVGMRRGNQLHAIHTDHLGTPRLVTDAANDAVWQWPYSAFGDNKPTGMLKATPKPRQAITNQPELLKPTAAVEMNLRFPGQMADRHTGWFYNFQRDYVSNQGRYAQGDPIGLEGGSNRYAYAGGNTLLAIDPFGLEPGRGSLSIPGVFGQEGVVPPLPSSNPFWPMEDRRLPVAPAWVERSSDRATCLLRSGGAGCLQDKPKPVVPQATCGVRG